MVEKFLPLNFIFKFLVASFLLLLVLNVSMRLLAVGLDWYIRIRKLR